MPNIDINRLSDAHLLPVGGRDKWLHGAKFSALISPPTQIAQSLYESIQQIFTTVMQTAFPQENYTEQNIRAHVEPMIELMREGQEEADAEPLYISFMMEAASFYHVTIITYTSDSLDLTFQHTCRQQGCYNSPNCSRPIEPLAIFHFLEHTERFFIMKEVNYFGHNSGDSTGED